MATAGARETECFFPNQLADTPGQCLLYWLRLLTKPDNVPVGVFYGCDQLTPADIFHLLLYFGAGIQEYLQTLLDVVHVIVAGHPVFVAVGIQTYILVSNPKTNVVSLIRIRLDAQ